MKHHPDLANQMLETFCHLNGHDSDFSNIKHYYHEFCQHVKVLPEEHKGPVWKRNKMEVRRLFISVMIRIYCPNLHRQHSSGLVYPYGFSRKISQTLNVGEDSISKLIRQVVADEKVYEDFRLKVDDIVDNIFSLKQLRGGKN